MFRIHHNIDVVGPADVAMFLDGEASDEDAVGSGDGLDGGADLQDGVLESNRVGLHFAASRDFRDGMLDGQKALCALENAFFDRSIQRRIHAGSVEESKTNSERCAEDSFTSALDLVHLEF